MIFRQLRPSRPRAAAPSTLLFGSSLAALLASVLLTPAVAQAAAPAEAAELVMTDAQARDVANLMAGGLADDLGYEVLTSLTTEVGPRMPGSDAEARARDWGAAKFKELGFKNVRIETFDMPFWERVTETAEIVSPFPQAMHITALGNSVSTPEDGVEAEVVRFTTLPELEKAPMEGLEGKIIFVDEPMARTQDGSGYSTAVAKRSGAAIEGGKRGAAAVIIRSVGTDNHRNPHTGAMGYREEPNKIAIGALSNPDADQLARAITRAAATKSGPVRVRMNLQTKTASSVTSGNVIGEIPGETDELIVIGGHLDSWDLGTGAIDDGAGIAITIAAAKLIDGLRGKPKRTIRVVMWGAEEMGLFGARAYAEAHKDELDRHVLASESDFGAGLIWQLDTRFGDEDLAKGKVMADALRPLKISQGPNTAFGGPDVSPLRAAGVPVISLRQDGSDYFDLHHTPDDTLDKVSPHDLRQNIAAWAVAIYLASELPGDFRDPPQAGDTMEADTE